MISNCFAILLFVGISLATNKIIGGRYAKEGEFPFVIFMELSGTMNNDNCGGVLVSLAKILTVAHCLKKFSTDGKTFVEYPPEKMMVFAGSVELGKLTQETALSQYKIHEWYKMENTVLINDVAVGDLITAFEVSETVKPMKIVAGEQKLFRSHWDELVKAEKTCQALGWGTTEMKMVNGQSKPSTLSNILKVLDVKPWSDFKCTEKYGNTKANYMGEVCVKGVKRGETLCYLDAGAPLVCDGFVYAIVALGSDQCDDPEMPYFAILLDNYIEYFSLQDTVSGSLSFYKLFYLKSFLILQIIISYFSY